MIMNLRLRTVILVTLLGVALSGCVGKEPGTATAGQGLTTVGSTGTSAAGKGIGDVKPCSLLESADVSRLKLSAPEDLDKNSCQWRDPDRTLIRANIYPDKSIDELVPGPNSEVSTAVVGKHDAKLLKKALSSTSCAYSLAVSGKSRVDVFASASTLDAACAAAKGVTEAVEPNLP